MKSIVIFFYLAIEPLVNSKWVTQIYIEIPEPTLSVYFTQLYFVLHTKGS